MRDIFDTPASRKRILAWLKNLFRLVVLGLVTWGIWRTVAGARDQFAARDVAIQQFHAGWLSAAALFYLAGMFPSCVFWHKTLQAMGQRPSFWATCRAFYIGHLGKYVPGKALVVVIRTSLIRSDQVNAAVAATSVFVETLTMMAVGAALAALLLGLFLRQQIALLALAVTLACCAGIPTLPPIFRRLIQLMQVHRLDPSVREAVRGLNSRLIGFGWLIVPFGWLLFGLSLWATLKAVPGHEMRPFPQDLPLLTACVSLAMVAGFLSLLPGGVGVREWVVMSLLGPPLGTAVAIISAVALRLVWLLAELLLATFLYFAVGKQRIQHESNTCLGA